MPRLRMADEDCVVSAGEAGRGAVQCERDSALEVSEATTGHELVEMPGSVAHRLARAWLSLGVGGLILFLAYTLALGHVAWSGATMWCVGLGGVLMMRGGRVVSRTAPHLLEAANQAALPSAKVIR